MGRSGVRGQDPSAPPAPLPAVKPHRGHFWEQPGDRGVGTRWGAGQQLQGPLPTPRAAAAGAGGAFIFVLRDIYFPRVSEAGAGGRGSLHPTAPGQAPVPPLQQRGQKGCGMGQGRQSPGDPEPWAAQCMGERAGGQGSVTPSLSLSLSPFCRCPCPPAVPVPVPLGSLPTSGPPQPGGSSPQHPHPRGTGVPQWVPRSLVPLGARKPWGLVVARVLLPPWHPGAPVSPPPQNGPGQGFAAT